MDHQPTDLSGLYSAAPEFRHWRDSFLARCNELIPERPDVQGRTVFRTVELDHTRAQSDTREIEGILATGSNVQRRGYTERLDMAGANLDRCVTLGGMPILWDHNPDRHIGFAEKVRVHGGVLRARLKFSDSVEALEKWRAIEGGTLRSISIGYKIDAEEWGEVEGQPLLIAKRWEPLECSVVAIPADPGALIGRSLDAGLVTRPPLEFDRMRRHRELVRNLDADVWAHEGTTGLEGAIQRASEAVMRAAETDDGFARAEDALREFRGAADAAQQGTHIISIRNTDNDHRQAATFKPTHLSKSKLTMENQDFFVSRAIATRLDGSASRHAGFEIEQMQELCRNRGGNSRSGLMIPEEVLFRSVTKAGAPGLIGTSHTPGQFVDVLRARLLTGRCGADIMTSLTSDISIPRQTADSTAVWIAGDGSDAVSASDPSFDRILMRPTTVGVSSTISRKQLLQGDPASEMLVRNSLSAAIAKAIDLAALAGDGTGNKPTGILETSGITTTTYANGGAPSFGDIVDMEGALMDADADMGALAYAAPGALVATLKQTQVVSGQDRMIWTSSGEGEGRMNGFRAYASNVVPAKTVIFGDWSSLIVGFWSGVDLIVDENSRAAYGDVIITALCDLNVAVKHAESFAVLTEAA